MIKKKVNSESEFLMNIPYKRLKKKILIGTVSKKKKNKHCYDLYFYNKNK